MARQIVTVQVVCSGCDETIRFEMFKDNLDAYGITSEGLRKCNFPRSEFPKWDLGPECYLGNEKLFCSSKCKGRHIIDNLHLYMHRPNRRTEQTLEGIFERVQEQLKICKERKNDKTK